MRVCSEAIMQPAPRAVFQSFPNARMSPPAMIPGWKNTRLVRITQTNYSTTIVEKNTEKLKMMGRRLHGNAFSPPADSSDT